MNYFLPRSKTKEICIYVSVKGIGELKSPLDDLRINGGGDG